LHPYEFTRKEFASKSRIKICKERIMQEKKFAGGGICKEWTLQGMRMPIDGLCCVYHSSVGGSI